MRNAGKIITVAAVAAALAACSPPSEQPSDLPPGADPTPSQEQVAAPPAQQPSSAPASPTQGQPCTAEDIAVTEEGAAGGAGPQVTIPQGCTAPTEILTRELREGAGVGVGTAGQVEFDYSMVGWSSGAVEENTFGQPATMTVRYDEQHEFDGWEEALADIKERGRRLIVVPADRGYAADSGHPLADQAVVVVVEVVSVATP